MVLLCLQVIKALGYNTGWHLFWSKRSHMAHDVRKQFIPVKPNHGVEGEVQDRRNDSVEQ